MEENHEAFNLQPMLYYLQYLGLDEAINKSFVGTLYVSGSFLSNRGEFSKTKKVVGKTSYKEHTTFCVDWGRSEEDETRGKGKQPSFQSVS